MAVSFSSCKKGYWKNLGDQFLYSTFQMLVKCLLLRSIKIDLPINLWLMAILEAAITQSIKQALWEREILVSLSLCCPQTERLLETDRSSSLVPQPETVSPLWHFLHKVHSHIQTGSERTFSRVTFYFNYCSFHIHIIIRRTYNSLIPSYLLCHLIFDLVLLSL